MKKMCHNRKDILEKKYKEKEQCREKEKSNCYFFTT